MPTIAPAHARQLWRAYLANATDLVDDARVLDDAGAYARARSLLVTAWCEIGRATTLADRFGPSWRLGSTRPQPLEADTLTDECALTRYCRDFIVGDTLEAFWGIGTDLARGAGPVEPHLDQVARDEARAALAIRTSALVVTREGGRASVPATLFSESTANDVRRTAEVIGMVVLVDRRRTGTASSLPTSLLTRLPAEQ